MTKIILLLLFIIFLYLLYNYKCNNYDKFTISSQVSASCQNKLINLKYVNKDNTYDKTSCVVKLNQLCSGSKTNVFECAKCAGINQDKLKTSGCEVDDISNWCSLQNVNLDCVKHVNDQLKGVCDDNEINYYCNNPTIFRYLYTFHPDPIINTSDLEGRNYSNALNLYIKYDSDKNKTYFTGIPCDPLYGDYKYSYPYLTRVDISNTDFFTSLFNSSNEYEQNDDCRCNYNARSGKEIWGTYNMNMLNQLCLTSKSNNYFDKYEDNKYIKLKTSVIDLDPVTLYSLGHNIITQIRKVDIQTVYLPDMQWFTNFLTMEDILPDVQKILKNNLMTIDKYQYSQLYEKVNLCTNTDLPIFEDGYEEKFNTTSLIFKKYEDKLNDKIFDVQSRNQKIKDVTNENTNSSIKINDAPNYCNNKNINEEYPNEFLSNNKLECDYEYCDYKQPE